MEILRNIGLKEATRKGLKGNLKGKVKCHIVTEQNAKAENIDYATENKTEILQDSRKGDGKLEV